MNEQAPHPGLGDGTAAGPLDDAKLPEGDAVSAAVGPVPAIYVPRSPEEACGTALLWHPAVTVAWLATRWALRHLPHDDGSTRRRVPGHRRSCQPAGPGRNTYGGSNARYSG